MDTTVQGIAPTFPLSSLLATELLSPVGLLAGNSSLGFLGTSATSVELSGLGQALSAASVFQDTLQALQPGAANSGIGRNFGTDLQSLTAEAQYVVDAFNNLQSNLNNLQTSTGFLGGNSLASAFAQQLGSLAQSNLSNGSSGTGSLAQIGISYQASSVANQGGTLSIDLAQLQSAFNSNPTGAFSVLGEAAQAFGSLAGSFVGQATNSLATESLFAQFEATQQLLSLSSLGSLGGLSGTSGLAGLLALESFAGGGNSGTLAQTILALNQFSLVSSLLG